MHDNETIDEIKQFPLGDLRDIPGDLEDISASELIGKALEPHSAVIFYSQYDPSGAGGSGTLVHYKGIKGILTASHVVAPFSESSTIFLPCILRSGTIDVWDVIEVPFIRILTIDDFNFYLEPGWIDRWSEQGLDISFIQIEDHIFSDILNQRQKKSLDLGEMRARYFSKEFKYWSPENKHNWIWTMVGTPREGCGFIEKDVSSFCHGPVFHGGGETKLRLNTLQNVQQPFQGLDVDIIETQIGSTLDILPRDFSGASGGGIYQTLGRLINGQFKIEEILLSGVFVAGNEEKGLLFSRGHIALYDIFCRFLDTKVNS